MASGVCSCECSNELLVCKQWLTCSPLYMRIIFSLSDAAYKTLTPETIIGIIKVLFVFYRLIKKKKGKNQARMRN